LSASRTSRLSFLALAGAALTLMATAVPAQAATGQVVVFSAEFIALDVFTDPSGCHKIPISGHVLNNQTDQTVQIYGDPFCMSPSLPVQPGYGAHVPPMSGSFSVG
jgi:hypothetical protein